MKTKQTTLQFASRKTYSDFKKIAKQEKLTLRLAITDAMKLWIATKKTSQKKRQEIEKDVLEDKDKIEHFER